MPSEPTWGTCRHCGRAVPPTTGVCPSCGNSDAVAISDIPHLPRRQRQRVRLARLLRTFIIVGVILGLTIAMVSAVWSGPPSYPDPLTTQGTYTIAPGNFTYLTGWITGEDYIDGNYTVVSPVGTAVQFDIYNSSGFQAWFHHEAAQPQWSTTGVSSSAIVFAAPYTDQFYLVFQNPYDVTSGIVETLYVTTAYESNVVIG
jgi:hypothetical protein